MFSLDKVKKRALQNKPESSYSATIGALAVIKDNREPQDDETQKLISGWHEAVRERQFRLKMGGVQKHLSKKLKYERRSQK